jgi:hypothetical protein
MILLYLKTIDKQTDTPSVPKCLSFYASRETTLIKYILKNINIYGI